MRIYFLIFIGVIIAMTSCDEKENVSLKEIESYPTRVGSYWDYNREVIIKKYESETSDKVIDIETLNFSIKVTIVKDTILNDTMFVKQFVSTDTGSGFSSVQYLFVDSEGLKCYAYSNVAEHVFAKKSMPSNSLSDFLFNGFVVGNSIESDDIYFENTPTLNLKLPLMNDSKWTYRQPNESGSWQIDKEVVGYETIQMNAQSFSCLKINWIYFNEPLLSGVQITDWISKEGLIKQQKIFERISILTSESDPIIEGNIQLTETLTLKELNIN